MSHLWLKALHVVAVVTFVGGTFTDAVVLRALGSTAVARDARRRLLRGVRESDRFITTPAMLVSWIAGITLALQGARFGQAWLTAKLVAVVALSGVHGIQSGRLRRLASADGPEYGGWSAAPAIVIALAAVAIVLVVVEPGS